MKDKALYLPSVLIAFVLGSLGTYLLMTKQQMDQVMQGRQQVSPSLQNNTAPSLDQKDTSLPAELQALEHQNGNNMPVAGAKPISSMHDYSQEQAMDIVNKMPSYMLEQYIDRFMTQGAGEALADKRQFAQRAIEELYKENDNQPLVGEVKLSLTPMMPSLSMDTSTIDQNATLFAHLDTAGKVPASPFVFVKWVNNQTGQVLLFEKKDIVANSNQNWVSFKPDEGWLKGSYDIRFYQFTSELQPIAQLTYQIYNVENSNLSTSNSGAVTATAQN
ncbi:MULTISPECIES: hypothetical protein [unclassified Psychrobacter]|uniref:hypothetical protein n=1 Tax=unclassified Psychrobacter TaxID=196806 RepID=UPI0025B43017|nr:MULTISPECIES: hypothetical protein [unclassified Psychrobacter]MDN3452414.1 hypothetical protein [Psychrobacter sp. APC 3350]MDN3502421.1 hypothetical protein [Psychrobacter sp. 5A.1]